MKNATLPRLFACLAATVTLAGTVAPPALADVDGPTLWGTTGLMMMPSGRVAPANRFRFGGSYLFGLSSTAGLHNAQMSLLDSLEFGLLYGVGMPVPGFSGLAGHFKWQALKPGGMLPLSLAFGGELLGMNTSSGYFNGNTLYGVLSYDFAPLPGMVAVRPHLGIAGNGLGVRMMAGLEVPLFDTAAVMAEYHSQQGRNGDFYNLGARARLPFDLTVGLYALGRPGRPFGERDYTLQLSYAGGLPFQVATRAKDKDGETPLATVVTPPPMPPPNLVANSEPPTAAPSQRVSVAGQLFDDQTHAPLVGARVSIRGLEQVATTDAEGRFSLEQVPPGSHELIIRPAAGEAVLGTRQLATTGGQSFVLELLVPREPVAQQRPALTGQVLSPEGLGLAGAEISVVQGQKVLRTLTNAEGMFKISALEPGDYRLQVEKPGWSAAYKPLKVAVGAPLKVSVTLGQKTGTIAGQVVDPKRRGLARVQVRVENLEGVAVSTGADGTYALKNIPPGTHRLSYSVGGKVLYTSSVKLDPVAGAPRAVVTLPVGGVAPSPSPAIAASPAPAPSAGTQPRANTVTVTGSLALLTGRVTDHGSRPLPGVRVMVESSDLTAMTLSAPDGSFQIRELPPGSYRLTVSRQGFVTKVIPMKVGSTADPQHVTLSRR